MTPASLVGSPDSRNSAAISSRERRRGGTHSDGFMPSEAAIVDDLSGKQAACAPSHSVRFVAQSRRLAHPALHTVLSLVHPSPFGQGCGSLAAHSTVMAEQVQAGTSIPPTPTAAA